ncbi:hypothetical protein [Ferruginibacter sp.]
MKKTLTIMGVMSALASMLLFSCSKPKDEGGSSTPPAVIKPVITATPEKTIAYSGDPIKIAYNTDGTNVSINGVWQNLASGTYIASFTGKTTFVFQSKNAAGVLSDPISVVLDNWSTQIEYLCKGPKAWYKISARSHQVGNPTWTTFTFSPCYLDDATTFNPYTWIATTNMGANLCDPLITSLAAQFSLSDSLYWAGQGRFLSKLTIDTLRTLQPSIVFDGAGVPHPGEAEETFVKR